MRYLGHPHVLTAPVEPGCGLGRTMGCPTVNQKFPQETAVPCRGVYAARVVLPDGRAYFGAANIGTRPTVSDGDAVTLETHILDFSEDLYGKTIRTELFAMLREERCFESKEALAARIRQDGQAALHWFETHRETVQPVNAALLAYVEREILPKYRGFDRGHDEAHVREVMAEAMELALGCDLVPDMVYCMAAYHDLGMAQGRKTHHLTSAAVLRQDAALREWFTAKQIEIMSQAVEDHRASSEMPPRSAAKYPGLSEAEQFARLKAHLSEKYSETGYLTLQLGAEKTVSQLAKLRECIRDEARLKALFQAWLKSKKTGQIG